MRLHAYLKRLPVVEITFDHLDVGTPRELGFDNGFCIVWVAIDAYDEVLRIGRYLLEKFELLIVSLTHR